MAIRLAILWLLLLADPARALEFRFLPDSPVHGTMVLAATGRILPGDAERFRDLLRSRPDRRIMLLINSGGGSVGAAAGIAGIVAAARMTVVVPRDATCASACFLILAASPARVASETARLGVHSASQENGETLGSLAVTTALARELHRYGVPDGIIGTLVTTPANRMAWLNDAERRAMNLIAWERLVAAAPPGAAPAAAPTRQPGAISPAAVVIEMLAAGEPLGFREGLTDRTAWERWLEGLEPAMRLGAEYWAAKRVPAHPGDCGIGTAATEPPRSRFHLHARDGETLRLVDRTAPAAEPVTVTAQEFAAGCAAARRRLGNPDLRRRSEADYRRGWASFLPAAYRQDALDAMRACRAGGGTPMRQQGFETVRDVNGDGRPDYLVDFGALQCRRPPLPPGSDHCDASGCALLVYVSAEGGGHARANAFLAHRWTSPAGAPGTLLLHDRDCGHDACARRQVWNGAAFTAAME